LEDNLRFIGFIFLSLAALLFLVFLVNFFEPEPNISSFGEPRSDVAAECERKGQVAFARGVLVNLKFDSGEPTAYVKLSKWNRMSEAEQSELMRNIVCVGTEGRQGASMVIQIRDVDTSKKIGISYGDQVRNKSD
jgi:hypothetical protein